MKEYPRALQWIRGYAWVSLITGVIVGIILINTMEVASTFGGYTKPDPMRWAYGIGVGLVGVVQWAFMMGFALLIESNIDTKDYLRDLSAETGALKRTVDRIEGKRAEA